MVTSILVQSLRHAPGRSVGPLLKRLERPRGRLVLMAGVAGIGHLQDFGPGGRDEAKRVAADVHAGDGLLDLGHVAFHAFVAGAAGLVVRVLLDRGGARTIRRLWAVALQTQHASRLQQVRVVLCTVHIMTTEACDATGIHDARGEIIALHAILVPRAVGEMGEGSLTQLVLFEAPKVAQLLAGVEADRPIVVLPFDRVAERLTLRVALDADIAGVDSVEARRIHDVRARGMPRMFAAGAVTFFTSHVPFRHTLRAECRSSPNGSRRRAGRWG